MQNHKDLKDRPTVISTSSSSPPPPPKFNASDNFRNNQALKIFIIFSIFTNKVTKDHIICNLSKETHPQTIKIGP